MLVSVKRSSVAPDSLSICRGGCRSANRTNHHIEIARSWILRKASASNGFSSVEDAITEDAGTISAARGLVDFRGAGSISSESLD
jgi:hypothetical protein